MLSHPHPALWRLLKPPPLSKGRGTGGEGTVKEQRQSCGVIYVAMNGTGKEQCNK